MIDSVLNQFALLFFFFKFKPRFINIPEQHKLFKAQHLNWVYIYFASPEQCRTAEACEPSPYFGGPTLNHGPGFMVARQEQQCRPWVHWFVCFMCSHRFLPQLHCMAASFVYIRGSNCAKGDLLRADTQLQVGAQLLFFFQTGGLWSSKLPVGLHDTSMQPPCLSAAVAGTCQGTELKGSVPSGGAVAPQEPAKLLTQAYLQPVWL